MLQNAKSRNAHDEAVALPPSAADYMLLAAALAVPLYTTSLTILQPFSGVIYVALCWLGVSFSYLLRSMGKGIPPALANGVGLIQLTIAFVVIANLDILNGLMPAGGFPWQMAPAAFMCWFLIGTSFFLWTDNAMVFLLVPGIALFGVQSYIETAANFAISMSLFMVSVAVLLTRLHMRNMKGMAIWAGFLDFDMLYKGPWRAVAGPALAIISVILISLASLVIAPGLGGAVRKLAGEPELQFTPPNTSGGALRSAETAKRIGGGPISASNMPVLEVTGDLSATYLRSEVYGTYVQNGFVAKRMRQGDIRQMEASGEKSLAVDGGKVYKFEVEGATVSSGMHEITVKSLARRHTSAYIPPGQIRNFEYDGDITAYGSDVVYLTDLFRPGKIYHVESVPPVVSPAILRGAPQADRRRNLSRNTGPYGDQIPRSVRELAQETAARGSTDYDDVIEIIREIQRRAEYNLQAEAMTGRVDRVETFLFDTQEGYCDLFAASLTVMCRAIGLQARAASGYLAPPEEAKDGTIIVRDRHAHLWTEVFFEGSGWVTFDATARARAVPGGEVGALLDSDIEGDNAGAAFAAIIGGGIFGLSFLGLVIGGFWPRLRAMFAKKGIERKVAPYYQDYLRALHPVLKRPKEMAETTKEFANAYVTLRSAGIEAVVLASMLDRALYSSASLSSEEWANLKRRIAELAVASKNYARSL